MAMSLGGATNTKLDLFLCVFSSYSDLASHTYCIKCLHPNSRNNKKTQIWPHKTELEHLWIKVSRLPKILENKKYIQ